MPERPILLFVAGPNGAGKSTFSKQLSEPDAIIFDADKVIAQLVARSPEMPKKDVYQASTDEFFRQAGAAVKARQHFTLETNFRDDDLMDIVAEFRRHGYVANMIYFTLSNFQQSVDRVAERVSDGGHFVDERNVRLNYDIGLQCLEKFAERFDNLEVVSASVGDYRLRSLLLVQERELKYLIDKLPGRLAGTLKAVAGSTPAPSPGSETLISA